MHNIVAAPGTEPLTLVELNSKLGLRAGNIADADLTMLLVSARRWVEHHLDRALITQTWETRYDAFPVDIELGMAPVQSVVNLKYVAAAGNLQTLDQAAYVLDNFGRGPHFVHPAYGTAWPSTRAEPGAVRVQYVCGYGDLGSDVPEEIRAAIVLIVGQSLRGQAGQEAGLYPTSIPNAAKELLQNYRILRF